MMGNLGATLDEIDWVITGYIVSNVIVIPLTGWLASRFGRKRYFTISILRLHGRVARCAARRARSSALVFWRVVQGLGGGALLATSQAIMVETFPARQQGIGQAIFGVGAMIGPSLGPTLGGWITDNYSWHWIFLINVPLGLLAASLCASTLRDPPGLRARSARRRRLARHRPAGRRRSARLQTVLERGHKDDWFESPHILWLSVRGRGRPRSASWRASSRTEHPVVDLRVLRRPALAVGCALGVLDGRRARTAASSCSRSTPSRCWTGRPGNPGIAVLPSSITTARDDGGLRPADLERRAARDARRRHGRDDRRALEHEPLDARRGLGPAVLAAGAARRSRWA